MRACKILGFSVPNAVEVVYASQAGDLSVIAKRRSLPEGLVALNADSALAASFWSTTKGVSRAIPGFRPLNARTSGLRDPSGGFQTRPARPGQSSFSWIIPDG